MAEREKYLGTAPYERNPDRSDYANGYKDKTITSRVGHLQVTVPQVRNGDFYPSSLEKGLRSERALKVAIAEMYVQGVSTRRVATVVEKLCGTEISSASVSRAAAERDSVLESWRNRRLGCFPYVYLDARYESVRQNGKVEDAAVLIAIGVDENGKRQVLGVSVAISEHEVHWRKFLLSLQQRGLTGVQLIVSNDHSGLKAARKAVFGGVPWQRCPFHLQQNAQAYVTKHEMKTDVAQDIRALFAARDRDEANRLLKRTTDKYEQMMPGYPLTGVARSMPPN